MVDEAFIEFFEFEHYSQKQIYEIAQEPNSLRQRIDKSIPGLDVLQNEREIIKRSFFWKIPQALEPYNNKFQVKENY